MRRFQLQPALILFALSCSLVSASETTPADPQHIDANGFRFEHYRAPLPESVHGAVTLDTAGLQRLMKEAPGLVLIDVQAIAVRPETREFGLSWLPNRHRFNIPGSIWLPNVGFAELDETMDAYFRGHLEAATGGDRDHPLVFYCVADCWLSWNSVKRAHGYGYRNLYWYPEGTDGWEASDHALTEATPVPLEPMTTAE